ncbi:protein-disulfide reductase DsbD family protein [Leucothrix arctica]|uniref:Glucan 1,4-alpha-glucosidase n=1 Tax=Leucothrix arctica TaxID=1481894 RepID=A0A317CGK4_9GAMM|nr:thioredoxin family protein [Leucothrix arctica]PWQ95342.1 glucan 1,4-alpha-glucosidase [Leucothrix arctica]
MKLPTYTVALFWFISLFLIWTTPVSAEETTSGDHVKVRWLAPDTFASGSTEHIGFYFEVDPKWHVYWRNAGDSGAAPRFDIQATGATVDPVKWPFPTRLPVAHLTNLGYEGNVAYLLPITPEAGAESLSLTVDLEWLVCKIDCIPGFGQMTLTRPIGKTANWKSGDLALRDNFLNRVPQASSSNLWSVQSLTSTSATEITLTLSDATKQATIFPLDADLIAAAEPKVKQVSNGMSYTFERVSANQVATTDFVVTDGEKAWRLSNVPIQAAAAQPIPVEATQPLWLLLLAAFVGGMILNLMPCVFPVLSIKMMGLVQSPASKRLSEAFAYTAGVLVTFGALGGLLLLLRASGSAIGWGFQLQSAPVILALITLFWLMALSFSGVFEFGHRLMTAAGNHRGGAFITGVLAVFVATPCTGPFMGVALGAAATLPPTSAMAIFLGLGAGLAAPFVLLCLSPALLRRLPKPGAWMVTLQQFLAFPLYLTVIWLLWVLGRLVGDNGWLIASLLMVSLVFAIWLGRSASKARRWMAAGIAVIALAAAFTSVITTPASSQKTLSTSSWQSFDAAKIAEARANNQAVFVDYTAAWCITCQVNKKLVLDTDPIQALFKENKVLLVRADWTHHDAAITESLAQFGRNSVPVYAWYAPGTKQAELLPQLLQAGMIRDLFNTP